MRPDPLKRRSLLLLVAAAAAVTAGVVAFVAGPRAKVADVVEVRRGPVVQSVVASGRVATPARIGIAAQAAARVDRVPVREGDAVAAGALLVELRSDEALAALRAAQSALVEARERVRQLGTVQRPVGEQQLVQAQANRRLAEAELARSRDLLARGFVSQARVDEAERALANAEAAFEAARAQAAGNRPGGAEAALAQARLEQAQANVALAQARLDALAIRAPVAATVIRRAVEPGDTAQVGRTLLELAQAGETRVIASIDEKNLRLVKAGLRGVAVADAFPDERFDGEVSHVAPAVDAQRGTVEIWLRVGRPPPFLRPDMTVSVEIVSGRRDDALVVGSEAVREADGPQPWVLAVRDGRAVRTPVRVGLRGTGLTELTGGVSAGDRLVAASASVQDGDRVRARGARPTVVAPSPAGR